MLYLCGEMRKAVAYLFRQTYRIICVLGCVFILTSCGWHEAKEVIATADSLDQTEHVIYDDTAALGGVIRRLDNPFGRLLMSNTLGKAYYYKGRNLEDNYEQVKQAAECYIMADRLQINDPIYRGRVNSCMGFICAQNNSDSLALIFYERANKAFKESANEWYYANILLEKAECQAHLHNYAIADSLLQIAESYLLGSDYIARYYETKGLYFYEQQQYDSALVYFNQGLNYWRSETEKCFSYVKIMQTYYFGKKDLQMVIPYANLIVKYSNNPNHLANAYYCLLLDAKENNDVNRLSQYTHARTDALKVLRDNTNKYAEATPKLMEYLQNPHPLRRIRITLFLSIILCTVLAIGIAVYRKYATYRLQKAKRIIDDLSICIKQQQYVQNQPTAAHYFEKGIAAIRTKHPTPYNKWNDYNILKKDIEPWLHNWVKKLDQLKLTDREKIYCIFVILYPHLPSAKLADYMNYDKNGIRVFKSRIAQKLGIKSSELLAFLQKLSLKH